MNALMGTNMGLRVRHTTQAALPRLLCPVATTSLWLFGLKNGEDDCYFAYVTVRQVCETTAWTGQVTARVGSTVLLTATLPSIPLQTTLSSTPTAALPLSFCFTLVYDIASLKWQSLICCHLV